MFLAQNMIEVCRGMWYGMECRVLLSQVDDNTKTTMYKALKYKEAQKQWSEKERQRERETETEKKIMKGKWFRPT